jgi:uncharacterized membrane protein YkoI
MPKLWKTWLGVTALAVTALIGAAVAAGAGSSTKRSTTTTTAKPSTRTPETPLTGDVAAMAKAAAVAKVGGSADRATTEADSSNPAAAYEVHVTKTDGTHVTVILDNNDNVLSVETGHGAGFGHERRGHGGNGETELTGDVAPKAKAAAVAKVGGTAERATTEDDSSNAAAAYEVHVTKADGSHVTVILDKAYNVLGVETHSGDGDHHR